MSGEKLSTKKQKSPELSDSKNSETSTRKTVGDVKRSVKQKEPKTREVIFRRQWDPEYKESPGENFTLPSKTVPDQNIGIKELLYKHSRGIPLGVLEKEGHYFDTEIPVIQDLNDMVEYRESLQLKAEAYNETNPSLEERPEADMSEANVPGGPESAPDSEQSTNTP